MKFSVGDKVLIVSRVTLIDKGKIGTIVQIDGVGYRVYFDTNTTDWWYGADEIIKATPMSKAIYE